MLLPLWDKNVLDLSLSDFDRTGRFSALHQERELAILVRPEVVDVNKNAERYMAVVANNSNPNEATVFCLHALWATQHRIFLKRYI